MIPTNNKKFLFNEVILKLFLQKNKNSKFKLKTMQKCTRILPVFVNTVWYIYNGQKYIKLKISENMVGYRFGDFILTRKKLKHKKNGK